MGHDAPRSNAGDTWSGVAAVLVIVGVIFGPTLASEGWPWLQENVFVNEEEESPSPVIYPSPTYSPLTPSPLDLLDCTDTGGPFFIDPSNDPYGLDADNDGIACE
jgi:hypothetical protein